MKEILIIDPISPVGHIMYNNLLINSLLDKGVKVSVVFRKNYIDNIEGKDKVDLVYEISGKYNFCNNGLKNRIVLFQILRDIKRHVSVNSFDKVVFSSYDEIVHYFSFKGSKKFFLINHQNIAGLTQKLKRFFFKEISKNNVHIVFEKSFKDYIESIGVNSALILNHGLPPKMMNRSSKRFEFLSRFKQVVFFPSGGSSDLDFLKQLVASYVFIDFIKQNNIAVVLRGNFSVLDKNIFIIRDYLSRPDYEYLFSISHLVAIVYPNSFKFRVSGVFFEVLANEKKCLLSENLKDISYEYLLSDDFYFKDVDDFIFTYKMFFYRKIDLSLPMVRKQDEFEKFLNM